MIKVNLNYHDGDENVNNLYETDCPLDLIKRIIRKIRKKHPNYYSLDHFSNEVFELGYILNIIDIDAYQPIEF